MSKAIVLLGITSFGCALAEPVVKVPEEGDASIIVVRRNPGLEITALAFESEPFISVPLGDFEEVYVLRYRCALDALALIAGPLEPDIEGRSLPITHRIGRASETELVPVEGWPDVLAEIRVASQLNAPTHCVRLEPETIVSPTNGSPPIRFVVPIDSSHALAYDANGQAFRLTASQMVPWTEPSTISGYLGGFLDAQGRLTLTGRGKTAIGSLRGGFVRGSPVDDASTYHNWIDGDPAGGELFLTGDDHRFHHFDGQRWTQIGARTIDSYTMFGGVLWLGPGRAWAIQFEDYAITDYHDGALTQRVLPMDLFKEQPSTIVHIDGIGTVLGTEGGSLFVEESAELRQRYFAPEVSIGVIAPLGRGLLFGGRNGTLVQYHPDRGLCPATEFAPGGITYLIPFTDGYFAISQQDLGGPDFFQFIRRDDPDPGPCEEP